MRAEDADADPIGEALLAHLDKGTPQAIEVTRDDGVVYDWSTGVLFDVPRALEEIDRVEREACRGRVLEVGAAAGRAALALERAGREVVAIDTSPGAVDVMRRRGLRDARQLDAFAIGPELGRFDAILLSMDSIGLVGTTEGAIAWLRQAAGLLTPRGGIVIDGCGYEDEPWASLQVQLRYGSLASPVFPWLYVSFEGLARLAADAGLETTQIGANPLGQFCARLSPGR
ncbi:MAG: class I SAM-dependent methyltransferase [Myxococcota bacterium]|nr:class I SAM-dependent methyltransferase [Myxococcota bacterium]